MPLQEAAIMAGHSKTETTMMYCLVDQKSVQHHHKKVFECMKIYVTNNYDRIVLIFQEKRKNGNE